MPVFLRLRSLKRRRPSCLAKRSASGSHRSGWPRCQSRYYAARRAYTCQRPRRLFGSPPEMTVMAEGFFGAAHSSAVTLAVRPTRDRPKVRHKEIVLANFHQREALRAVSLVTHAEMLLRLHQQGGTVTPKAHCVSSEIATMSPNFLHLPATSG